jgi:hypothetical protein
MRSKLVRDLRGRLAASGDRGVDGKFERRIQPSYGCCEGERMLRLERGPALGIHSSSKAVKGGTLVIQNPPSPPCWSTST